MSDHCVCFVPTDPRFIPNLAAQDAAVAVLRLAWPEAREIASDTRDRVVFRDCGANFESVRCPHCDAPLKIDAWQDLMDGDFTDEGGFGLAPVTLPCCGAFSTLNDLRYDWQQAFSRFAVIASDPGQNVTEDLLARLESALGCRLRVIHQLY